MNGGTHEAGTLPIAGDGSATCGQMRWGRVAGYLALVFALSWGLGFLFDSLAPAVGGRGNLVPPLGMLVPALVAIFLRVFVFHDSPISRRSYGERPVWVLRGFLILFLIQVVAAVMAVATNAPGGLKAGDATLGMLVERGLTYDEALELIVVHPMRRCRAGAAD